MTGCQTPAILITGNADADLEDHLDQYTLLLRKPISMDTLKGLIHEQINQDPEYEI